MLLTKEQIPPDLLEFFTPVVMDEAKGAGVGVIRNFHPT